MQAFRLDQLRARRSGSGRLPCLYMHTLVDGNAAWALHDCCRHAIDIPAYESRTLLRKWSRYNVKPKHTFVGNIPWARHVKSN
jgi:hypothetical protein